MNRQSLLLLLLRILRAGLISSAGLVVVFFAIEAWKNWFSGAEHEISIADIGFLAVLVAVFVGALALVRAIGREIRNMETITGDDRR